MSKLAKAFEYAGRAVATVVGGACAAFAAVATAKLATSTGVDPSAMALPVVGAAIAAVYLPVGLAPRQTFRALGFTV